jgi:uncharacterized protein (DUF2164 family)
MAIEITPAERDQAIAALQSHLFDELDLEVGTVAADGLLSFVLSEIAPLAYNRGVADAQARLHVRVEELTVDLFETPFARTRSR